MKKSPGKNGETKKLRRLALSRETIQCLENVGLLAGAQGTTAGSEEPTTSWVFTDCLCDS